MMNLFLNKLHAALQAEVNDQIAPLAEGSASDFLDYKDRVGFIRGLRRAMDVADGILKQIQES